MSHIMSEYSNTISNNIKYSLATAFRKMKNVVCKKRNNQYSKI